MSLQKIFRNIERQAKKIAKKIETDAKKLLTKACMNERSRIRRQIAFKSSGKRGTRSKPGERPRTEGGRLNRMMMVHVKPNSNGDVVVSIGMRWKAPKRSRRTDLYRGKSPAIALDEGFGNTAARPYIQWIRETVKTDMRTALEKAARQIGHLR